MPFKGKAVAECIQDIKINDEFLEKKMTSDRGYGLFAMRDFCGNEPLGTIRARC